MNVGSAFRRYPIRNPDAVRWNERYARDSTSWLAKSPAALLTKYATLIPDEGVVLDAASGVGTNGLYLAENGVKVFAFDISEVGLTLAMRRARARWTGFFAAVLDISRLRLPENYFDAILNFRFLERSTFQVYRQGLKPGGLLFFESFVKTSQNTSHASFYLNPGELLDAFRDYEVIDHAIEESKNLHRGHKRLIEKLVARKPF